MAKDIRTLSGRARLFYGLGCIALGGYPVALSLGFFPSVALLAPAWVVGAAGLAFVIAGFMILLADHERANDLLASLLLLLFAAMGAWVALYSSDDGFSGGLPFVRRETNIMIGRWFFGLGALISLSLSAYAFRRYRRR